MKQLFHHIPFFLFILAFFLSPTIASSINLTGNEAKIPLGTSLSVLEDESGSFTFDDINSPQLQQRFEPSLVQTNNYGYTETVYWVRFLLANQSEFTQQYLLEIKPPWIIDARLFVLHQNGSFETVDFGGKYPLSHRIIRNKHFLIPIILQSGQQVLIISGFNLLLSSLI